MYDATASVRSIVCIGSILRVLLLRKTTFNAVPMMQDTIEIDIDANGDIANAMVFLQSKAQAPISQDDLDRVQKTALALNSGVTVKALQAMQTLEPSAAPVAATQ